MEKTKIQDTLKTLYEELNGKYYAGEDAWSYIKNEDNNWYKFNDNIVSTMSKDKLVSENAYCLFYSKK